MRHLKLIIAVLGVTLAASAPAVGARPATQQETDEMMSAATRLYGGPTGWTLTPVGAIVSTVSPSWGYIGVDATAADGSPGQGAGFLLERDFFQWNVVEYGTGWGGCSQLAAIGVPRRVLDDLQVSDVSYRCAAPPAPAVPCITSFANGTITHRFRPRACDISLDGTTSPSYAALVRLRALRWVKLSRTTGVAVGVVIPNHAPFTPVRVRATFTRPVDATAARPGFSRVVVVTRYGTSGRRPLGGAQPN